MLKFKKCLLLVIFEIILIKRPLFHHPLLNARSVHACRGVFRNAWSELPPLPLQLTSSSILREGTKGAGSRYLLDSWHLFSKCLCSKSWVLVRPDENVPSQLLRDGRTGSSPSTFVVMGWRWSSKMSHSLPLMHTQDIHAHAKDYTTPEYKPTKDLGRLLCGGQYLEPLLKSPWHKRDDTSTEAPRLKMLNSF